MLEAVLLWVLAHFWATLLIGGFILIGLKAVLDRMWPTR